MGHVGWGGVDHVGWGGVGHVGVGCVIQGWSVSYRGGVESHLSYKSQIKLLSELLPIYIQLFTNDPKSKNSNL